MNAVETIENIWLTYQVMESAVKVTMRSVNSGQLDLLHDTYFLGSLTDTAKRNLKTCRSASGDYAIFAMWAIFERIVIGTLMEESSKMLDTPASEFNRAVHNKIEDSIEFWRTADALDLIKPLVGADLAGQAKQIKRYRDWLAHKNPRKPSPGNIPPAFAYGVLSAIARRISDQRKRNH